MDRTYIKSLERTVWVLSIAMLVESIAFLLLTIWLTTV